MPSLRTRTEKVLIFGGLSVLFFCLLASLAFAAAPIVGTISPSSGSTLPNVFTAFTCTYADTDGWANLKEAYLLISANSTALANSAYLYYNQNSNLLYLRNDSNTAWLGGYAPGSSYFIENSQAKVWCAFSSASGSGATLTVKFYVSFKTAYSSKSYNSYLKAVDDTYLSTGWAQKGAFTVNYPPNLGYVSPSSGTFTVNTLVKFSSNYSDFDGCQQLQGAYFLINTSTSGANCAYLYYNQNTNQLFLRNDTNTAWLGGYAPGSIYTIENSYAKLDCSKTSVTCGGTILSVDWNIIFKSSFTGTKNLYLYVIDDVNAYKGWLQAGSITIPNSSTTPPQICTTGPLEKSTFTEGDSVSVYACANFFGSATKEFQVSVNGAAIKPWFQSATACTCNGSGVSFTYPWVTKTGDNGNRTIKVEARNSARLITPKETKIYIFRKPAGPP